MINTGFFKFDKDPYIFFSISLSHTKVCHHNVDFESIENGILYVLHCIPVAGIIVTGIVRTYIKYIFFLNNLLSPFFDLQCEVQCTFTCHTLKTYVRIIHVTINTCRRYILPTTGIHLYVEEYMTY